MRQKLEADSYLCVKELRKQQCFKFRWYHEQLCRPFEGVFLFYERLSDNMFNFEAVKEYIPYLLGGLGVTLVLALSASVLGSILGFIFALMLRSKRWYSKVVREIIDFFRGTPVIFQLAFFYLALPQIIPVFNPTSWFAAIFIFTINSGSYMAEIIRAGIDNISVGQIEAAYSLGVSKKDVILYLILPQALRNILPALMNEFITLIKETSVVSTVGLADLMRRQQLIYTSTYRYFEPLLIVGIIYYIVNKVLSNLGKRLERKLNHARS